MDRFPCFRVASLLVLLCFLLSWQASAFLIKPSVSTKLDSFSTKEKIDNVPYKQSFLKGTSTQAAANDHSREELDIVLFGVGDLRVDDHEGLARALQTNHPILPLVLLDDTTLSQIPGMVSHTIDTTNMLVAALEDLQRSLQNQLGLELQVVMTESLKDTLETIVQQQPSAATTVRLHVHDLGDVDNLMGYSPFSQLGSTSSFEVVPWTSNLRMKPWATVESLPDRYPDFVTKYSNLEAPTLPVFVSRMNNVKTVTVTQNVGIPTSQLLVDRIADKLKLDPAVIKAEVNTGIFQSHWGGLDAKSIGESKVLENLNIFVEQCQEDDALWAKHPTYVAKRCSRNPRSLEHATFNWFLENPENPKTDNLLAGEPMTRYLSAPLLFGTISSRRIWHSAVRPQNLFVSPLKTLVEGREWHRLLAAKNVRTRPDEYANLSATTGETTYNYWRWHGFLCRYAQTPLTVTSTNTKSDKEGVLFFHGFGASGTQWNKLYQELSKTAQKDALEHDNILEGLAPDLLGFGESEKPPISYTIYVWDAFCTDFIKEVAVTKKNWNNFIVGGNSIGGFSAASTAANECASVDGKDVCSSGAPGTNRCQGVVLMNPAGPILSREDAAKSSDLQMTVAQISASGGLPACKPPPRLLARTFGNALLSYLRPRIQSICVNLYPTNPVAVDDALCKSIDRDSLDPGAINVMVSGAKLPPPRSMNEMLEADFGGASEAATKKSVPQVSFKGPVLVATGVLDPLNDAKGRSEGLVALRPGIEFDPINAGHCPHDELSKDVATAIAKWRCTAILPLTAVGSKVTSIAS